MRARGGIGRRGKREAVSIYMNRNKTYNTWLQQTVVTNPGAIMDIHSKIMTYAKGSKRKINK